MTWLESLSLEEVEHLLKVVNAAGNNIVWQSEWAKIIADLDLPLGTSGQWKDDVDDLIHWLEIGTEFAGQWAQR